MLLGTNSYAPHVLSVVNATEGIGRRSPRYQSLTDLFWYTTWFLMSGTAELQTAAGTQRIQAPMGIIIPPASDNFLTIPRGSEFMWMEWGVTTAKRIPRSAGGATMRYATRQPQPQPAEVWGLDLPVLIPESLFENTRILLTTANTRWYGDAFDRAAADALLAQWLITFLESLRPRNKACQLTRAIGDHRAKSYVQFAWDNLTMIDHSKTWAELIKIGRHQLNRVLQQATQRTTSETLNLLRREKVLNLIHDDQHTLGFISMQCGFHSVATFNRWFQRHFSCSPATYRKNLNTL